MENIHGEIYKGYQIEIWQEENSMLPNEWGDDGLFLVANHRQFYVKPPKNSTFESVLNDYKNTHYIFGLEAYIHSGVILALSNEGNFCDRQWDVSQLGLVFVAKSETSTKQKARKLALGLLQTWNNCLAGNVWGFTVNTPDGNIVESVGGFIGSYDDKDGPITEAKSIIDYIIKEQNADGIADISGQYLTI